MDIERFTLLTKTGQISWKKTAENILKTLNKTLEPERIPRYDGYCPKCGSDLLELGTEIFCENQDCSFDKILNSDMWFEFIEKYNIPIEK